MDYQPCVTGRQECINTRPGWMISSINTSLSNICTLVIVMLLGTQTKQVPCSGTCTHWKCPLALPLCIYSQTPSTQCPNLAGFKQPFAVPSVVHPTSSIKNLQYYNIIYIHSAGVQAFTLAIVMRICVDVCNNTKILNLLRALLSLSHILYTYTLQLPTVIMQ